MAVQSRVDGHPERQTPNPRDLVQLWYSVSQPKLPHSACTPQRNLRLPSWKRRTARTYILHTLQCVHTLHNELFDEKRVLALVQCDLGNALAVIPIPYPSVAPLEVNLVELVECRVESLRDFGEDVGGPVVACEKDDDTVGILWYQRKHGVVAWEISAW